MKVPYINVESHVTSFPPNEKKIKKIEEKSNESDNRV